jgi:release factor glutamine methyltransferase
VNLGEKLSQVTARLKGDWPQLDAQLILAHAVERPRTWILAHPEESLTPAQMAAVESAVSQVEAGTSLPYVLGHWEFFGLEFVITPDVLIPRPETETLVERAIAWLQASPERRTIADIGTGSGAIAVTLAMHVPDAYVIGTDVSLPALKVAQYNARKFELDRRMDFIACDLLPPHPEGLPTDLHFDLICANLPYIPTETLRGLRVYGREPTVALDGGADGLKLIRRLLGTAIDWLAPHGRILLEIEATLGVKAVSLAYDFFSEAKIRLHQDLTGRDRLLEIQL